MKTAFVSFSGLLGHLWTGAVTQDDLATGLFFFGTNKDRVMGDPPPKEHVRANADLYYNGHGGPFHEWLSYKHYSDADLDKLYDIIGWFQTEIRKATEDGRVAWWDRDQATQWPQFVALLGKNGVDTTEWDEDPAFYEVYYFNLGEVEKALRGKVRIVWGGSKPL